MKKVQWTFDSQRNASGISTRRTNKPYAGRCQKETDQDNSSQFLNFYKPTKASSILCASKLRSQLHSPPFLSRMFEFSNAIQGVGRGKNVENNPIARMRLAIRGSLTTAKGYGTCPRDLFQDIKCPRVETETSSAQNKEPTPPNCTWRHIQDT